MGTQAETKEEGVTTLSNKSKGYLRLLTSALILFGLGISGCAKPRSQVADVASEEQENTSFPEDQIELVIDDGEPFTPEGDGPGEGPGDRWEHGASATLVIEGDSHRERMRTLGDYTGRAMNNPTNIAMNLNLTAYANKSYGGTVTISYREAGLPFEGFFTSGRTDHSNQFNVWITRNNQKFFRAFFEDRYGAVIVVIDNLLNLGDGANSNPGLASGLIYYKNFPDTMAPNPLTGSLPGFGNPRTFCWFISLGPFDCRAWPTSRGMDINRAIYPDNGYKILGRFANLRLDEAFNHELKL